MTLPKMAEARKQKFEMPDTFYVLLENIANNTFPILNIPLYLCYGCSYSNWLILVKLLPHLLDSAANKAASITFDHLYVFTPFK